MTGPLSRSPEKLMEELEKNKEIWDFLEDALAKKIPVVYLGLGSIAKWAPWSLNAVHKGLKDMNIKVIWSLKEEYYKDFETDPREDPKFILNSWLP